MFARVVACNAWKASVEWWSAAAFSGLAEDRSAALVTAAA
jgi:hypothetical protein